MPATNPTTFPVKIEHGNHSIWTQMHALPRPGDHIDCAFPSSGIPKLLLIVEAVWFHQPGDFEGKDCPDPFWIAVTTVGDPTQKAHNDAAMAKALRGEG